MKKHSKDDDKPNDCRFMSKFAAYRHQEEMKHYRIILRGNTYLCLDCHEDTEGMSTEELVERKRQIIRSQRKINYTD